jgi:hypothetical protein
MTILTIATLTIDWRRCDRFEANASGPGVDSLACHCATCLTGHVRNSPRLVVAVYEVEDDAARAVTVFEYEKGQMPEELRLLLGPGLSPVSSITPSHDNSASSPIHNGPTCSPHSYLTSHCA